MALNDNQLKAIEILVINPGIDWNELAETVGVSPRTLYDWRTKNDEWKAELQKRTASLVDTKLYEAAIKGGNVNAAKLFYERYGILSDDNYKDPNEALFNMSEAERDRIAELVATEWIAKKKTVSKQKASNSAAGGIPGA